jgi:hypothetical protein
VSLSKASLATRRENISRQIARQRTELAEAYRDLGRPLRYTQTAVKGVQMLKENAWLLTLVPTVVGLASTLFGLKKKTAKKWPKWLPLGKRRTKAELEEEGEKISRRTRPLLARLLGHGISAFKVYRRVRPYIPL